MLLHVLFYSKIASEKEQFDIADVCNSLADKLIFRHPHIYGNVEVDSADKVAKNWEEIKLKEKGGQQDGARRSADGSPRSDKGEPHPGEGCQRGL